MAELKKCPFCGGEAYLYKSENLLGDLFFGVDCESNECIVHTMTAEYPTEEKAIEAWNNRATEADIRAKAIDEFAEKLKNFCESSINKNRSNQMALLAWQITCAEFKNAIEDISEQLKEE